MYGSFRSNINFRNAPSCYSDEIARWIKCSEMQSRHTLAYGADNENRTRTFSVEG